MPDADVTPRKEEGRVPTGIPELDTMLHGGLLGRRPYLVIGPSGTGKTTLALCFLCEGVRRGEETLVVTLEEPPNEMRFNHPALAPEIDRVWVFDAIPDVMRYERAPFKDVAQARDSVRFQEVTAEIRKSPELASVEVTLTALEQTLRMQMARRSYKRIVIDSLTALQYFCMKGLDEVQGAQSFLRFLSELGATTLLTMESPLEEFEAPERMLARGEIRLFRWEDEGRTVRAIGVEKFRGSGHDNRLHPYRIGGHGMDLRLDETVSRDPRRGPPSVPLPTQEVHEAPILVTVGTAPPPVPEPEPAVGVGPILDEITGELVALHAAGLDLGPVRGRIDAAHGAMEDGDDVSARAALADGISLLHQMGLGYRSAHPDRVGGAHPAAPPEAVLPDGSGETRLTAPEVRRLVDGFVAALGERSSVAGPDLLAAPVEPPAPPRAFEFSTDRVGTGPPSEAAGAPTLGSAAADPPTFAEAASVTHATTIPPAVTDAKVAGDSERSPPMAEPARDLRVTPVERLVPPAGPDGAATDGARMEPAEPPVGAAAESSPEPPEVPPAAVPTDRGGTIFGDAAGEDPRRPNAAESELLPPDLDSSAVAFGPTFDSLQPRRPESDAPAEPGSTTVSPRPEIAGLPDRPEADAPTSAPPTAPAEPGPTEPPPVSTERAAPDQSAVPGPTAAEQPVALRPAPEPIGGPAGAEPIGPSSRPARPATKRRRTTSAVRGTGARTGTGSSAPAAGPKTPEPAAPPSVDAVPPAPAPKPRRRVPRKKVGGGSAADPDPGAPPPDPGTPIDPAPAPAPAEPPPVPAEPPHGAPGPEGGS